MGKNQHVTPHPKGGWQVKGAGNTRATVRTSTQKEAADIARKIAINQQSERLIHRVTGEIRQKDSYGHALILRKDKPYAISSRHRWYGCREDTSLATPWQQKIR